MALNKKCPKCGSSKTQLVDNKSKHGFIKLILFGMYYMLWYMCKVMFGTIIFLCYDWWMAIIAKSQNKGYTYASKRWFTFSNKIYYCHDCGHNFRG